MNNQLWHIIVPTDCTYLTGAFFVRNLTGVYETGLNNGS